MQIGGRSRRAGDFSGLDPDGADLKSLSDAQLRVLTTYAQAGKDPALLAIASEAMTALETEIARIEGRL